MSNEEEIREAIDTYYNKLSAGDLDGCLSNFESNAVIFDPIAKTLFELKRYWRVFIKLIAMLNFSIESVSINGDTAFVKWMAHAIGKNGKEVDFEGSSVFTFNDKVKITKFHCYWEPKTILPELEIKTNKQ